MNKFINKLIPDWLKIAFYKINGSRPWSRGYSTFKFKYIKEVLDDSGKMEKFRNTKRLPEGYGYALDERVVEYPWILSRIPSGSKNFLDAGSTLNFKEILENKILEDKKITIANLNPESNCFWQKGISYIFEDIRNLPFKDNYFDFITCVSTLEHVGMNNNLYINNSKYQEEKTIDFEKAVLELKRVLKENGKLFITVPFGKYQNFGWFQQFDLNLVNKILEVFGSKEYMANYYKYKKDGWDISNEIECKDAEYGENHKDDFVAASGAVACLELIKK